MAYDHPRDFAGYGAQPADPKWPGGARVAVQIVMNYEEARSYAIGEGDGVSRPTSPKSPARRWVPGSAT